MTGQPGCGDDRRSEELAAALEAYPPAIESDQRTAKENVRERG